MRLTLLFIGGIIIGWTGMSMGFAQSWWPISVSGEAENVIAGRLTRSAVFSDRLEIQSGGDNILVDMGAISENKIAAISGKKAIIRGKLTDNNPKISGIGEDVSDIMEASWFWVLPW